MIFAFEHEVLGKDAELLFMIAEFFKRIAMQLKSPWLFYQLDFMNSFEKYLKQGRSNNSLMIGLSSGETLQE